MTEEPLDEAPFTASAAGTNADPGAGGAAETPADPVTGGAVSAVDADVSASGFILDLEGFHGPFDVLLGLIAQRQMDVTTVALSEVTDEFISYVRALDVQAKLDESSQFLVLAATLLELKLSRLLPGQESDADEKLAALESRDVLFAKLLQYKAFKDAAEVMKAHMVENAERFPRQPGTHPEFSQLLPPLRWNTTVEQLREYALAAMTRQKEQLPTEPQVEHLHGFEVTVADEVEHMLAQFQGSRKLSFEELVADAGSVLVVVVRFLGLLELFRDGQIDMSQQRPLAELIVERLQHDSAVDRDAGLDGDAGLKGVAGLEEGVEIQQGGAELGSAVAGFQDRSVPAASTRVEPEDAS